ncbi:MAG: DUF2973 domain-containing protein [Phormidium sp. BM_Day4_Bin.17]|nr:DUF2973 domain-containing protein [Phormidium sp. BM_Day4_Bin.17]UCJ13576.1 MAG: DUF2973 domain-containing protein [Phormidium sp. PBR-2020]
MLHLLYILAFTFLAFVAVGNLVRNLLAFSSESQKPRPLNNSEFSRRPQPSPHPELLDDHGRVVEEPLLVMRSIGIEDAREKLDALYNSSPSGKNNLSDDDDTPPPALI